jgi:hypothetical protein
MLWDYGLFGLSALWKTVLAAIDISLAAQSPFTEEMIEDRGLPVRLALPRVYLNAL